MKSLLHLVSRSLEEQVQPPAPLLGLQANSKALMKAGLNRLELHSSNGIASRRDATNSCSHGDFDSDPATLNHILATCLGEEELRQRFTPESLGRRS